MNEQLALNLLSKIMEWDDVKSHEQFAWLRLMARMKYDGYRDYQAGMRFIERLAAWLQQFKELRERATAYQFIKDKLLYISTAEMQTLVESFYPKFVKPHLYDIIASQLDIKKYMIFNDKNAENEFKLINKRILYMGLSGGAMIDLIRRSCVGNITNEQAVLVTQVDKSKWEDMINNLRDDTNDKNALFNIVYLIDDFVGTGTSLLRFDKNKNEWKGKLVRFFESQENNNYFNRNCEIFIHHYIATDDALKKLKLRYKCAYKYFKKRNWVISEDQIKFTNSLILQNDISINNSADNDEFISLTEKYYNKTIETKHTKVGGVDKINLGYGGCALPLILEHNTPNNSIALLWAEANEDDNGAAMRPLFRRRQRHT